jgi:hypothetical protein
MLLILDKNGFSLGIYHSVCESRTSVLIQGQESRTVLCGNNTNIKSPLERAMVLSSAIVFRRSTTVVIRSRGGEMAITICWLLQPFTIVYSTRLVTSLHATRNEETNWQWNPSPMGRSLYDVCPVINCIIYNRCCCRIL